MEIFKAKLIARIKRAGEVESFRFIAQKKIGFLPGQFLQLVFDPDNPQNKELNKHLSFSSSPLKEYIEVTKRLSASSFSDKLRALKVNDEVTIKAPLGSCVFKDEYPKIGFLIGGIGITPVISILEYIIEKKLSTAAVLFYSNRTEEDISFHSQLDDWQKLNKNIEVFYTVTDCQPKAAGCIFGRIDRNLLVRQLSDYKERVIFIFGPPKMVEAMHGTCLEIGCRSDSIKIENFMGY